MELRHIDLAKLSISAANMRAKGKAPDIANILPSVRARGVLVPLIVRAKDCPERGEGGSADTSTKSSRASGAITRRWPWPTKAAGSRNCPAR